MAKPTRRSNLLNAGLAALTGLLLWMAFQPLDIGAFAWLALVPWLIMITRTSSRKAIAWSALAGMGLFTALLHWLRFVDSIGWLALAAYCALYLPVAALAITFLKKKRIPFVLSAPLVITALEFIRAHLLTGFPFYFLGHTQHLRLAAIQIFLIAMVNGSFADLLTNEPRTRRRAIFAGGITACLVALVMGYGFVRLNKCDLRDGPRVCIVQANIPLDLKHSSSAEETFGSLTRHVELSRAAAGQDVDLVIWPETMVPGELNLAFDDAIMARIDGDPKLADYGESLRRNREEVLRAIQISGSHLLAGAMSYAPETREYFNSACFLSPDGDMLGRYDKMHLVVFGEYTPFANALPFLKGFRPAVMGPDLSSGRLRWLFDLPVGDEHTSARFGVTICYEDSVPNLFRKFVRDGADFMVNMTNDGWFRDSSELDHHLAICAFRAIENRVPIARCANTGISALIAPNGKVQRKIVDADGRSREVEGTLVGNLRTTTLKSFYAKHGDLFAWLCLGGLLAVFIAGVSRKPGPEKQRE